MHNCMEHNVVVSSIHRRLSIKLKLQPMEKWKWKKKTNQQNIKKAHTRWNDSDNFSCLSCLRLFFAIKKSLWNECLMTEIAAWKLIQLDYISSFSTFALLFLLRFMFNRFNFYFSCSFILGRVERAKQPQMRRNGNGKSFSRLNT